MLVVGTQGLAISFSGRSHEAEPRGGPWRRGGMDDSGSGGGKVEKVWSGSDLSGCKKDSARCPFRHVTLGTFLVFSRHVLGVVRPANLR